MPKISIAQLEAVADRIIELAPKMHREKIKMLERIGKELKMHSETLQGQVQTMKAVQSGSMLGDVEHSQRLISQLRREYLENPAFREKIKKALELYRPHDPFATTEKIADKILELAKKEKAGRWSLADEIAKELEIGMATVKRHLQTMRALQGKTKPPERHETEHYPMLLAWYRRDSMFRRKIDAALEAYDMAADLESMKNVTEAIIKYAPACRKSKRALREHIAQTIGLSEGHIKRYVQVMGMLAGTKEKTPGALMAMYPALEHKYKKDAGFRERIQSALEAYGAVEAKNRISQWELIAEAKISLSLYEAKKPKEEKTAWVRGNILKRVKYEALHRLAMEKKTGTNELLADAIRQAGK